LDLEADPQILQDGLAMMVKRGNAEAGKFAKRLESELTEIKAEKLRWLTDDAIPALQKSIDSLHSNPMRQGQASAVVVLPKIAWVLNHKPGEEPNVTVTSMALLKEEIETIKNSIQ